MKIKQMLDLSKDFVVKNLPTILTVGGVVTSVTSTVYACIATPKAIKAVEDMKEEVISRRYPDEIPENPDTSIGVVNYIKALAPIYWPVVVSECTAIACIVGSNSVNLKRQAALFAAYTMSENNLNDYKKKVLEKFGKNKSEEVRDEVIKDQFREKTKNNPEALTYYTGYGDYPCYDAICGDKFTCSKNRIEKVINDINEKLNRGDVVPLNDYYEGVGLRTRDIGDALCFDKSRQDILVEPVYTYEPDPDTGVPTMIVSFNIPPELMVIPTTELW